MTFSSAEEELLWFLSKMSQPGWKWPSSRSALPPEHTAVMYCKYYIHSIQKYHRQKYRIYPKEIHLLIIQKKKNKNDESEESYRRTMKILLEKKLK